VANLIHDFTYIFLAHTVVGQCEVSTVFR